MQLLSYAAIFITLAIAVAASPRQAFQTNGSAVPIFNHARFVNANGIIDLDTIRSHVAFVHSKISLGFNNYETNAGWGQKSPFSTVVQKRQHYIPLVGSAGQPWSVIITLGAIGHGSKRYHMSLDTASADTFLPDLRCDSTCEGHKRWDSLQTKAANTLKKNCLIGYSNGGEVSGRLFTVSVFFTDTPFYTTPSQLICSAFRYPPAYQSPQFGPDGVMGMAFSSISSYGASTVFQNLVDYGQVAAPVFSLRLLETIGELYLGGVNDALFSGIFTYVPVIHPGFWLVEMDDILAYGLLQIDGGPAIIDTGSSFLSGPSSQVAQLQQALGGTPAPNIGEGIYVFWCVRTPPGISLRFGGTLFFLPGRSLSMGEVTTGSGICVSAVIAKDLVPGLNLWIIGTPFLRHVYSTFDARDDRPQVGFAKLAGQS